MSNQKEIIAIVDQVGRTVVGVETGQTDETLTLNNPVIVHVQPDPQNGQLQVQTFPYLFMEFIEGDKQLNEWTFHKSNIATSTVKLLHRSLHSTMLSTTQLLHSQLLLLSQMSLSCLMPKVTRRNKSCV